MFLLALYGFEGRGGGRTQRSDGRLQEQADSGGAATEAHPHKALAREGRPRTINDTKVERAHSIVSGVDEMLGNKYSDATWLDPQASYAKEKEDDKSFPPILRQRHRLHRLGSPSAFFLIH